MISEITIWHGFAYLLGIATGWVLRTLIKLNEANAIKNNIAFLVVLLWASMHVISMLQQIQVPLEVRVVTTAILAAYFPEVKNFVRNAIAKKRR